MYVSHGQIPKGPLFFISLFLMTEIIYHFKICKVTPNVPVINSGSNIYTSFTLHALNSFYFANDVNHAIRNLIKEKSVQFILQKSNILSSELPKTNIVKQDIAKKALSLVENLQGTFITRMDIFAAYLLLTEQNSHLLFSKHLKEDEFMHILYWARADYFQEEFPQPKRALYWGEGFFDSFTVGWSLETKKYTSDITYKVLNEKPVLLGRKKEFQELIDVLLRQTKNNALLVGETGVGKTSLIEALAMNSFLGLLSGNLYHKRIYQLMTGLLVAGIKDMGELEERLESILQELYFAGNIVLYISDMENILGSSTFHVDLSGALLPYLKGKHIPVVATITPPAYKNFVEPNSAFVDIFEVIRVEELNRDEAIQMMLEKAREIETENNVTITYKAIVASVDLAVRYEQGKALPGSAVSLLSSVAASIKGEGKVPLVDEQNIIEKMEEKTKIAIGTPKAEEKDLLLHMEETLHKRVIGQKEAVKAISEAIRRVRAGLTIQTRPISFLFLGPTGVGKTETAKALASVYFGGEDKTIRLDMSEYTNETSLNRLLGSAPGQGNEKGELTEKVYEHPFSLVLLDEFEKAHPEVLDLFLQVLEDGRLTDNHGKRVNFANTIIIATSNAGALWIQKQLSTGRQIDSGFQKELLEEVENEHIFRPELLNRFDATVVFCPLTEPEIEQIANLELTKVQNKLKEQDISIFFDQMLIAHIAQAGFDPEFGARPLRRFIQDNIEDPLAKNMLEGKIIRGSQITIGLDQQGMITFAASSH
jgi:ATP-dependent Clp protease ATP-binding subunit ClpC